MEHHGALKIVFVEDVPEDVELEVRTLRKSGLAFDSLRVETRDQLTGALADFKPSLVISDFTLPRLDGLEALRLVRAHSPDLPFIFVSGTIGEERAIESLKNGATDYVVKDRLSGLPHKVDRALRESRDRAARIEAEERLRQAQKMEAIGRLAGGVAHDFNNLLTVINGYSQLLFELSPDNRFVRNYAQEILKAGERAAGLTRRLLAFSRKQVIAPAVLDLNAIVAHVEQMLRRLLSANIDFVVAPSGSLRSIRADAGQVEQVILNLCLNARDAMPDGGSLILSTADVGSEVLLGVTDTGTGMDEETRAHLFEPFFTTKPAGKGTGLGLPTVYGIVEQSGGRIVVESVPGQGSTFKVFFPAVEASPEPLPPAPALGSLRGSEVVLLVEDSESVRKLMTSVLSQHGYRVLLAENGERALQLASMAPGPLHLLITDVVLPGMSGTEIAERVAQLRPATRVLFISGDADRNAEQGVALAGGTAFLPKPFSPDALAQKVREVLGR